jgi:uracil-DNA glycosylase family 4
MRPIPRDKPVNELKLYPQTSCDRCDLHEHANIPCIPTVFEESLPLPQIFDYWSEEESLDAVPLILFIGQNPGFQEDKEGSPFVGRSGQIVKKSYIDGIDLRSRASIYLTNGVRCYTQANEAPKPRHYRECATFLSQDIHALFRSYGPHATRIIVTLGAPATTAFYKHILEGHKMSLSQAFTFNGGLHHMGSYSFHLFSTYHPAAVLRNNNLINTVQSHMQLVSDCLDGTMATPSEPNIVPSRSPQ